MNSPIILLCDSLQVRPGFKARQGEMTVDFKEASFIQGKLIRITKKKVEVELDDEETGEPALATLRLADGVNVDIDSIGEEVKAVIVDGKVARITALTASPVRSLGRTSAVAPDSAT